MTDEKIDHPRHYNAHASGVEAITLCEHLGFNLGNAAKYLWREGEKGNALDDLRKAQWYLRREVERVRNGNGPALHPVQTLHALAAVNDFVTAEPQPWKREAIVAIAAAAWTLNDGAALALAIVTAEIDRREAERIRAMKQ